jgi:hypothetical protein
MSGLLQNILNYVHQSVTIQILKDQFSFKSIKINLDTNLQKSSQHLHSNVPHTHCNVTQVGSMYIEEKWGRQPGKSV